MGQEEQEKVAEAISLRSFLESHPPGARALVNIGRPMLVAGVGSCVALPGITLHCTSEDCQGPRQFRHTKNWLYRLDQLDNEFIQYTCRNCGQSSKTFSIRAMFGSAVSESIQMQKFGEIPAFGPPTPARVATLLGGERDYYFKGRRAESQSMGVAAFAYYRRVVENKKAEIIGEVLRVSRLLNADGALLAELEQARNEVQFTKAVEAVKHAIPQVLLINGHNPLTLLHSALSEGLHAQSDEECLELAASIRLVLTEFVERVATAMKDEKELAGAVSRLLQVKSKAGTQTST